MMSELSHATRKPHAGPGVIDTMGRAFALLSSRPYLIWPVVLIDVLYWLAPTIHSSTENTVVGAGWARLDQLNALSLGAALLPGFNLLYRGDSATFSEWSVYVNPLFYLLWGLTGLLVVSIVVAAQLTIAGGLVLRQPLSMTHFLPQAWRIYRHLLLLALKCAGFFVLAMMPILVVAAGLAILSGPVTYVLSVGAVVSALWVLLYLFFSPHSLVLSEPKLAIALSYQIVRRNRRAVLGFLLITGLVLAGIPSALQPFAESPWSVPFAIIVHSFLLTGIITAAMLFVRDRTNPSLPDAGSGLLFSNQRKVE